MLEQYRKKRDFTKTSEPAGTKAKENNTKKRAEVRFVVQKHDATNLHYDFRLETEDVLKSWAVPKGISLDPKVKRLAVLTEDHPLDYLLFEGTIPKGSYGGGTVIVWDTGSYTSEQQISHQFTKGKITFTLFGKKLKGRFSLVKTQRENRWLLIKGEDEFKSAEDMTITRPESVLTGRTNQDLEIDKEDKANSNKNKIPVTESKKTKTSLVVRTTKEKSTIVSKEVNLKENGLSVDEEFPTKIGPMLSTAVDGPFNERLDFLK
jgi:bifunctional non-homologous end joining protein LigD